MWGAQARRSHSFDFSAARVAGLAPTPIRSGGLHSARRANSICNLVSNDAPQRLQPVYPGDLFPFFIGAARVGDRHFVNPPFSFSNLCRNLRFESKPVRLDFTSFLHFSAQDLLPRL